MKKINVMYGKPVSGCLIHVYEDVEIAKQDAISNCKENNCSSVIMIVEFEINKNGEVVYCDKNDVPRGEEDGKVTKR